MCVAPETASEDCDIVVCTDMNIDFPTRREKIWGRETFFHPKGKVLELDQSRGVSSLHYHKIQEKTLYVCDGQICLYWLRPEHWQHIREEKDETLWEDYLRVEYQETPLLECRFMGKGGGFDCPPLTVHRVIPLPTAVLFEVSDRVLDSTDKYRIFESTTLDWDKWRV